MGDMNERQNGNASDDSMDSSDSESDGGMRVGDDYQAVIPEYNPDMVRSDARAEAMLVWAPHPDLTEMQVDEYVLIAKERHGYNMEQALGMLFWHKHLIERALTDLANFTPFPDEWTVEDKVLFEQAFSFHGKSFHRIRQMLPDKTISQLVKYYYSWKKTRSRTSLMDRQARKIIAKDDSEEESASDSETETKEPLMKDQSTTTKSRPGPASKKYELHPRKNKHKRRPPRGMYLTQEDLLALATGPPAQGDALLKQLDTDLGLLKRKIQNNRQQLRNYRVSAVGSIDNQRTSESQSKINARWSNDELLLAVQGVRRYGKNFSAIAEMLGNKTEAHIRSFFVNHRKKYNLDDVLASHHQLYGGGEGETAEVIDLDPVNEECKMETEETDKDEKPSEKMPETDAKDTTSGEVNGSENKGSEPVSSPPPLSPTTQPPPSQTKDKETLQTSVK